jgi:L-lactate dehydrogenase (cytochrome)
MTDLTLAQHLALDPRYASIDDLEKGAKRKLPKFAFDYLQGGIGPETGISRNRQALDNICLLPRHLVDRFEPSLETEIFGQKWSAPFGMGPIGLSGLIWPDAASHFARTSADRNIPTVLSTVATTSLESIAKLAPDTAWFQLYVPNDESINHSLINRAKAAGYKNLVVTVDVPTLGRRERDIANALTVPPKITLANIVHAALHPHWSLTTLAHGVPKFENLIQYVDDHANMRSAAKYVSALARGHVDLARLQKIRDLWDATLIVKGILNGDDAKDAKQLGCDGIIVSNHGARQLDAAPAPVEVLTTIRKAVGKDFPLLIDSGARSGLDVARLLASGADFVFLGRAFAYSVAALGAKGPYHADYILKTQLENVMSQLGCRSVRGLPATLVN